MLHRLNRIREAKKKQSGFTLIELLIVIVILGILAAVVVFSVSGLTNRGNAAACRADVATVTAAGEAYIAASPTGAVAATMDALQTAGYLHSVPTDVAYVPGGTSFTATGTGACVGYTD